MYNIHLIYLHGNNSLLSVKNRIEWRTKKIAIKHAQDIASIKTRTGIMKDLLSVVVENDSGGIVKSFAIA